MKKKEKEKLLYCICCMQMKDPETKDDWVNEEKFRERNIGDRRLIDGGIKRIDYCPECEELFQSDREFEQSAYKDSSDNTGFAST